ncbi:MAG: phosphoglycerate kinase [Balneolales bacterium]
MAKLTLNDIDVNRKKVVMRVDFNVPIKNGKIGDDNRIQKALPSIRHVIENNGLLILLSHLGRPKGKPAEEFSLHPVAEHLRALVDTEVFFGSDCIGPEAEKAVSQAGYGQIVLLENVRFHEGETKNDPAFSQELAKLGEVFVNDAFGSSHRAHSSVAGITDYLQPAAAGYLLEREIDYLEGSVQDPQRPFVAIIGGAKVSDKIGVIENLINKVDSIIIGGGMTYTFYKALNLPIGNSLVEEDKVSLAAELMERAKRNNVEILLPLDSVVAKEFNNDAEHKVVPKDGIEDGWMALDIGPKSSELFGDEIKNAKTIIWNGPMGVFEMDNFAKGTFAIAGAMSTATENGAITIIGGGDSASAIKKAGLENNVSHVSTGGGASLEYLEGKVLPGIQVLTEK